MHMQRFNEAIEYHDEAIKSNPNDSLSYNYKSIKYKEYKKQY